jgi:hypothetical protein
MGTLPIPPKYPQTAPTSLDEWIHFWRWLTALWRKAENSIDAQEASVLPPIQPPGLNVNEAIGESLALPRFPVAAKQHDPEFPPDIDLPTPHIDEALIFQALGRPPYPARPWMIEDDSATLVGLPAHPSPGLLYRNSYFGRVWYWNDAAAAWHYNDAGVGAGGQVSTSGPAPSGGLWQACDGSTVACALDNATIGNLTATPAQATAGNNPTLQGGAGDTTQHAATNPTYLGGATVTSGNDSDGGITFADLGSGSTAAINPHTHSVTVPTINAPTDAAGLGLRVSMALWMRR